METHQTTTTPTEPTHDESLKRKRGNENEEKDDAKRVRTETQAEASPLKTKQYVPKPVDDGFEDILVSGWFYLDSSQQRQGPFTTRDMKEWYISGFFTDDMLVTRVNMSSWKIVSECDEFKNLERRPTEAMMMMMYAAANFDYQPVDDYNNNPYYQSSGGEVDERATEELYDGKVVSNTSDMYWQSKGLPSDKDGRMLSHYLDVDEYQEKMRQSAAEPKTKKRTTKKMVKAFKKKKEDQRRKRILMM